jgi:hypothetical protein
MFELYINQSSQEVLMSQLHDDHWHICVCCNLQFTSLSELMRHMTLKHTEEEVLFALEQEEKRKENSHPAASSYGSGRF